MKNQGRFLILITLLFIIEDIVLLNLLFLVMLNIFDFKFESAYQILLIFVNLGYLLSFAIIRVDFNNVKQLHVPHLIWRNFYKLSITAGILISCLFFLKVSNEFSRLFILSFFPAAYFLMTFTQWITRKAVTFTIRKNVSKGIILGAGPVGQRVFDEMLRNIYNGVVILGFFDDNPDQNNKDVLGTIEDAKEYILKNGVTNVFSTLPLPAVEQIQDFIKFSESHVVNFHIVPDIGYYHTGEQPIVEQIGEMPVFVLRSIPLNYAHQAVIKRCVDILLSSVVIFVLLPVLFPILAILIKLSSPGPIFFVQQRTGKRGENFNCYKFRTMRCSDDANIKQATVNDNRKTRIGTFLRKTSLDELPQLFNVLIGNMSLVGPRPHMLKHTDEYSPKVDKYMVRHFIKPGITGLAQVSGFRGETKEIELMEERVRADIYYVENWTLKMDLQIMAKTALTILKVDEKAY